MSERAMLSDRGGRAAGVARRYRAGRAMAEAMAEARRILAETEAGVWTYNGPWRGLVFGAGGALVSRHIARDAMVDALAAFVGADDPGAHLATVARR